MPLDAKGYVMKQIALFYNFSSERISKARFAALPLKISVKAVEKSDFCHPIGYLAGVIGIEPAAEEYSSAFEDEMIVMCGFNRSLMDSFIRALNKCGVGRVPLKAVITDTNKTWSANELHAAVKADHEEFTKANK